MKLILKLLKYLTLCCLLVVALIIVGTFYYIEFTLPNIDALNTVQFQVPLRIFTKDGKLIAQYGERRRIPLPYNQIPKPLIEAVLATEDQRYFQHPGVDIPGLMRAAIKLAITHRKEEGGSTITMQVARSFYLTRHKTFGRKLREVLLALKIDHRLSKQKILELYLNKIFFGARAYGVEAAAEVYYGKPLSQLSLDQYAMIAGLPQAPSALNPIAHPVVAKKRRDHVLSRMRELGYIDEKTYQATILMPIKARYHDLQSQVKAPHAAELARQQLEEMYGDSIYTDGYAVYTTIDSNLQNAANSAVHDRLLAYDQRHGYRGPEQNWGTPDVADLEAWEVKLNNISTVNGLEPAAVIDMTSRSVTVLRADGNMATIPWQGLSWARKQINANFLGRMPSSAGEILKLGDIIRIMPSANGVRLAQLPRAEAGLIALNPQNGAILALVGGFNFQGSNFDVITNGQRQPGSSIKPFIYSAALDKGYTLATVINDAPVIFENRTDNSLWRPQNDTHQFYGPTRLRDGLIHSRNLVSIRLMSLIGVGYTVNFMQRFGFERTQLPAELSLALGTATVTPLQMAAGYAVFANSGFKITPYAIDNIRDSQGKIVYQAKPLVACDQCVTVDPKKDNSLAPRVLKPEVAYLVTSALKDVIQHGTAIEARSLQRSDLAGKTGTTNNQVDAWFAGYNPELVAVAWVGFPEQQQSLHEWGAQAALPVWMQFMRVALENKPIHPFNLPTNVVSIKIDPATGFRAAADSPKGIFEYFMTPYLPEEEKNPMPAENTTITAPENNGVY